MGSTTTAEVPETAGRVTEEGDQPECLACYLDRLLPIEGCDGDLRLTRIWHGIRRRRTPVRWLQNHGGFCDCEVTFNVFGRGLRSARHRELQCDAAYARATGGDDATEDDEDVW